MFTTNLNLSQLIKEARADESAAFPAVGPAGNPVHPNLFVRKGDAPNQTCVELDFFSTRWDLTPKGQELLEMTGFKPRATGVKKSNIPQGKEEQWLSLLIAVLDIEGVFATKSVYV